MQRILHVRWRHHEDVPAKFRGIMALVSFTIGVKDGRYFLNGEVNGAPLLTAHPKNADLRTIRQMVAHKYTFHRIVRNRFDMLDGTHFDVLDNELVPS